MIDGECYTNLDDWKRYRWPTKFVAVPRIGERVKACGTDRNLKVVGVTHCEYEGQPYINVELNK